MARLFLTDREFDFMSDIYDEVVKDIAGHAIYYYQIDVRRTDVNQYGEAVTKVFRPPVYIEAAIDWQGAAGFVRDRAGLDKIREMTVYLHVRDMERRDIAPREGDMVQYGGYNFEVHKATRPSINYGHVERYVYWQLECKQSRVGALTIGDEQPPVAPGTQYDKHPDIGWTQSRGEGEGDVRELQEGGPVGEPITGAKFSPFDVDEGE